MSIVKYDEALYKKLSGVFPQVYFGNRERVDYQAQDGKEEKLLPYMSVWRTSAKPVVAQFGTDIEQRSRGVLPPGRAVVRNVPVRIEYQLDIVSDKREEIDEIWREIYFYLVDDPSLSVDFGGSVGVQVCYLKWEDIEELTDIVDRERVGSLYRVAIDVSIPQAQLFMEKEYYQVKQVPIEVFSE